MHCVELCTTLTSHMHHAECFEFLMSALETFLRRATYTRKALSRDALLGDTPFVKALVTQTTHVDFDLLGQDRAR